jgi:hypothetical protein
VGNVTLPSPYNSGSLAPVTNNALFYSGPYDAYVTGLTPDGYTTTTAISAQSGFFIQPYVYVTGPTLPLPQTSGLVLTGTTIKSVSSLTGDLFLGSNTISGGTVAITSSQIQGTLTITNARVTLTGVSGGDINAANSNVVLIDSSVGALTLSGSNATLSNSSYQRVSPAQATIAFGPVSPQPASGKFSVAATITGQLLTASGVTVWVDGSQVAPAVATTPTGLTATASLDASTLADGVHTLAVSVTQSDGISTSASTFVTTNGHLTALNANLTSSLQQANQLISQQGTEISNMTAQISNLTSQVKSNTQQLGTLMNFAYGLSVVAVIGVAIAVLAFRRKPAA